MLVWIFVILLINVSKCQRGQTPYHLVHINEMDNLAQFDDAQHRGPNWYDYSVNSLEAVSSLRTDDSSSLGLSKYSEQSSETSTGSSKETDERKRATKMYRTCHPCPTDMLKKYTNIGIKWICAGYQRARRSFKSDCMLRYRNCQDGTTIVVKVTLTFLVFVKVHDHKCRNDTYHGRSWFYGYNV